jgi:hypothetical protein
MATVRAHIVLPAALVKEIDELVGPRGRSAFIVEITEREIKRRKLLAFAANKEPIWRDENHPELVAMGTAAWVRSLRNESSARLPGRDENLDPE